MPVSPPRTPVEQFCRFCRVYRLIKSATCVLSAPCYGSTPAASTISKINKINILALVRLHDSREVAHQSESYQFVPLPKLTYQFLSVAHSHSANVLIYPAQVQGDSAPGEVMAGLRHFHSHFHSEPRHQDLRGSRAVEVLIIARGGGSAEDLACFNHEGLARAVADSKIPVISAIGHETDFTIVDFVADLRAPTPSAAAELVIRSRQEIEAQAEDLGRRLERAVRYRLMMARQELTERAQHGAFAQIGRAHV